MRSLTIRTTTALAIAASATVALTTPAQAAPAYSTTFYATATYTGSPQTVDHLTCAGDVTLLHGRFQSFDNRPIPGCKAQVYNNASPNWLTLCIGRSTLPLLHQSSPEVRLVPGTAPVCLAGPW